MSKTTPLRREAIDRECQIRLPGCEGAPCCLCHFRMSGISGMGMKSPDWLGAWAAQAVTKRWIGRNAGTSKHSSTLRKPYSAHNLF